MRAMASGLSILTFTLLFSRMAGLEYFNAKSLEEHAKDLLVRRMLSGDGCPASCKDLKCPGRARNCQRGVLRDVCNCCNICSRDEGEVCGGKYYIHGKCARDHHCDMRTSTISNPVGVCVHKSKLFEK